MKSILFVLLLALCSYSEVSVRGYTLGQLYFNKLDENKKNIKIKTEHGRIVKIITISSRIEFRTKLNYLENKYGKFSNETKNYESGQHYSKYLEKEFVQIDIDCDDSTVITYTYNK